jgi:hypothetical protein
MYDTIHIFLPDAGVDPSIMSEVTSLQYIDSGQEYVNGYFKVMRISSSSRGVSIKGSLPKMLSGHNIDSIMPHELPQVLQTLSDGLHLDVSIGIVKRIDVAATFSMDNPPSSYLPLLACHSRSKRVSYQDESLTFLNRARSLSFYDKTKELRSKRGHRSDPGMLRLQQSLSGLHLLRYEYQFKKPSLFFERDVTAVELFDSATYALLISEWKNGFESISKASTTVMSIPQASNPKEFMDILVAGAIQTSGGLHSVLEMVSQSKLMSDMQKYRTKKRLKRIAELTIESSTQNLLKELSDKIILAADSALSGDKVALLSNTCYSELTGTKL